MTQHDLDFIAQRCDPFVAHLLRRVSDLLVEGSSAFYSDLGISAPPRTTSTLLLLSEKGALGITAIAAELHQAHPLVITWVRQLEQQGFVATAKDPADSRRTMVSLTAAGETELARIRIALAAMTKLSAEVEAETGVNLPRLLVDLQARFASKTVLQRLRENATTD